MAKCNIFIFLDNVQFSKNSFQNRVKIKTPQGTQWLTVPVHFRFGQLTYEVKIDNQTNWREKHLKTFEMNYKRAPFFDEVYFLLKDIYLKAKWTSLVDFNIELIMKICGYLDIKPNITMASTLGVEGKATELLIGLIKKVGGNIYLSGTGGMKYQDEERFKEEGIELVYSDFVHPIYPQLWGDFIGGLSIIDLLFNMGGESRRILIK
jgi:hypothetical protein